MADDTPNEFYSKRNQEVKIFKEGIELRNDQRSDHFYRKCEYLTALHHADFEVTVEELPAAAPTVKTDQFIWQRLFSGGEAPSPPVVKSGLPENIFITARKPLEINRELPVTAWETV